MVPKTYPNTIIMKFLFVALAALEADIKVIVDTLLGKGKRKIKMILKKDGA
jgi:hypothetical protein